MADPGTVHKKRKTILELFGEMAFSDIDYLDDEDLGGQGKKDKGDIKDEGGGNEDDSEGETIGSEDWSLDESDIDSQELRELADFIVEDDWEKEDSSVDFTDSDDSTVWEDSENGSDGDGSEISQVYEPLDSTDEDEDY